MNTSIVNDALKLCINIYNSIPPNDSWAIVNIARSDLPIFNYPRYPKIPWSFGYTFDAVPKFLKDEGVIEALNENHWFTGISRRDILDSFDNITIIARAKEYLKSNEGGYYFSEWKYRNLDEGPVAPGQYSILINKQTLIDFYNQYCPPNIVDTPTFDISTGKLYFLGESITINGEINIKTMDILVKNVNSRVGLQELYEVRGDSYNSLVVRRGKTVISDIVKKVIKSLNASIEVHPKLKYVLIIIQKDGFGLFVDKKGMAIHITPQKAPHN